MSLILRMMHTGSDAADVQHFIFDEVHDASAWQLFVLSMLLAVLISGVPSPVRIYLMTATQSGDIFAGSSAGH